LNNVQAVLAMKKAGVVPIVRTQTADQALRCVEAILEGGIDCVEITMTVAGAIRAIERVADRYGDKLLLGAGTVLDAETARSCMLAGAEFFVTPALNVRTIEMAKRYSKAIFPGALTPTEILTAWEAGADGVKVFPANALGGAKYIKAVKAPLPQVELVPTGGVTLQTVGDFLSAGSSAVGVGSELVDNKLVSAEDYRSICDRARQFREAIAQTRDPRSAAAVQ
jgi:2-dehydro-3-deoxyphosphogluconate aldolase/(4S)-4-hydroxy-2-oxoglutarate aldolase